MGLRFGALIIDAVVMFGAFFVAAVLAAALSPGFADRVDGRTEYSTAGAAVLGAWVVFFFLYHPVSWWRFGCTIGQRAMGMRVVRALDGRRLHLGAVVLRYVVWFACMLPLGILAIIAAIVASNEPAKRAWHDEASGSVVIKTYG